MENIIFSYGNLEVTTYTKGNSKEIDSSDLSDFFTNDTGKLLISRHADELPMIFYVPNKLLGVIKTNKEESLKFDLTNKIAFRLQESHIDPSEVIVYFAPSITFSHVEADEETINLLINKGYEMAAKRTSGVSFFDIPLLNIMMLRKAGIKMKNIYISEFDTYENPTYLYSKARGDKQFNFTIIEEK